MDAIREIRPQILMLNWRRAARWARSADHSERSTDSAADRRGSYLLSSVEESCRESDSQRSWVQIPPGPLTSSVIFWARIYDLKSVEGCPLVLREGAGLPSPRVGLGAQFHHPAMYAEIVDFVKENPGLTRRE